MKTKITYVSISDVCLIFSSYLLPYFLYFQFISTFDWYLFFRVLHSFNLESGHCSFVNYHWYKICLLHCSLSDQCLEKVPYLKISALVPIIQHNFTAKIRRKNLFWTVASFRNWQVCLETKCIHFSLPCLCSVQNSKLASGMRVSESAWLATNGL